MTVRLNSILSIFHNVTKTLLRERIFHTQYTQLRGSVHISLQRGECYKWRRLNYHCCSWLQQVSVKRQLHENLGSKHDQYMHMMHIEKENNFMRIYIYFAETFSLGPKYIDALISSKKNYFSTIIHLLIEAPLLIK